ncbi:rho GTPase-activating protein 30 [Eleutherodactylus coqui]|uniref:rho GTPase-activating protein 30 n=1 Tax=Eleutherodactylus coqui TaxID=57060 RepID=UPI003461DA19
MSLAMKARQKVKKKTVKDKIFGCDLLEHLQLSGQEVPQVLKSCAEFVEEHGIVDGIYRLCGIASNVHKLRQEFDIERLPELNKSTYLQDVHCVSSLCKAYFRELPNPLLTYQLYDKFADAVAIQLEEQRLIKIREVLKELPLPHYRTLEHLMKHLLRMASYSSQTNMHARNLAIVWAPNLLRSKDIESTGFNGTAAFMEVRIQSIVVEFILTHVEQLFGDWRNYGKDNDGSTLTSMNLPTCVPEDYYRSLSYNLPNMLNHGDGPPQIRPYHTIIEFSDHKRKGSLKAKKWKSIFNLGRSNPDSKRKSHKQEDKEGKFGKMSLRPAKSMDSLSSVPHATVDSDLEQNGLALRSPRNHLSLRRESFGSPSKENVEFTFLDSEEQLHSMDTNDGDYEEEEGQAKSEPTTPKPGRSTITGNPQGRSPKSNPSRAEKCVGVHISGPFSVTLPFHITSNLSRLTRGMECPGLSIVTPHRSAEKLISLEDSLSVESDDAEKAKPRQVVDKDSNKHSGTPATAETKAENARISLEVQEGFCSGTDTPATEESKAENVQISLGVQEGFFSGTDSLTTEEPKAENTRISLEVQDTFSFLDVQDTSIEKLPENTVDSEMLEYDLHAVNKMEEFSVEPPSDYLCVEDDPESMYFMPTGCVDEVGHWKEMQESLEDIYLSAHNDLDLIVQLKPENMEPSSEEQHCILNENFPSNTGPTEGNLKEDALGLYNISNSQDHPLRASETQCNEIDIIMVNELHGQHCNPDDGATIQHMVCIEESEYITYIGPFVPNNELQEDAGFTDGNNMNIVTPENRVAMSEATEIQHKALDQQDNTESVKSIELEDCSAPPRHERAANNMDCTADQHHGDQRQDDDIPGAPMPSQQPMALNILLSDATLENDSCEDEDSDAKTADSSNEGDASSMTSDRNTSENRLSRTESISRINSSPEHAEILQQYCTKGTSAEESITENHHGSDDDNSYCLCASDEKAVEDNQPCNEINPTTPEEMLKDSQEETDHAQPNEDNEAYPTKKRLPDVSKPPAAIDYIVPDGKHPDGSVTMRLMATTNKIHQAKSVPIVPPKPQFAKLPPALKGKIQVGSSLSTSRETRSPKSEKTSHMKTPETSSDTASKRRSSWRNATSISFDTAMALAKERQSQNPVRRMQTYCMGDSYEVIDRTDSAPHGPRFTVKPASSRTHRPISCMSLSCSEGEQHGPNTVEKDTIYDAQSISAHKPDDYSKENCHRNRLSMPRLGEPCVGDDQSKCHQQRRSLL